MGRGESATNRQPWPAKIQDDLHDSNKIEHVRRIACILSIQNSVRGLALATVWTLIGFFVESRLQRFEPITHQHANALNMF
jgi:hypothetical protein